MMSDATQLIAVRRGELLAEAEMARLAAQVEHQPSAARRVLARVCYGLADWLDAPAGYLQPAEAGQEDWASPLANV
jgi:hypothetical protein